MHIHVYDNQSYPVKESQIHPHVEGNSSKMYALWKITKQLVIKRLHPIGVTALK